MMTKRKQGSKNDFKNAAEDFFIYFFDFFLDFFFCSIIFSYLSPYRFIEFFRSAQRKFRTPRGVSDELIVLKFFVLIG
jgi:hypothetical protein